MVRRDAWFRSQHAQLSPPTHTACESQGVTTSPRNLRRNGWGQGGRRPAAHRASNPTHSLPTCVTPASPHNLGRDGRCQSVGARQHIGLILVQVSLHSIAALGAAAAGPVGLLQRPLLDLRGMRRKFGLGSWVGNLSLNGSRCRVLGGAGAATVGLVRSPLLNQNPNTQQLPLLQCPVPPFPLFSSPHLAQLALEPLAHPQHPHQALLPLNLPSFALLCHTRTLRSLRLSLSHTRSMAA